MKRGVWILVFLVCIGLVLSLPPPPPPAPSIGGNAGQSNNVTGGGVWNSTGTNTTNLTRTITPPTTIPSSDSLDSTNTQDNSADNSKVLEMEKSLSELNTRLWIITGAVVLLFLLLIFFIVLTKNKAGNTQSVTSKIVPDALRNYVQNMRMRNVPRAQLEQQIRQAGYSSEIIDLVLKDY